MVQSSKKKTPFTRDRIYPRARLVLRTVAPAQVCRTVSTACINDYHRINVDSPSSVISHTPFVFRNRLPVGSCWAGVSAAVPYIGLLGELALGHLVDTGFRSWDC